MVGVVNRVCSDHAISPPGSPRRPKFLHRRPPRTIGSSGASSFASHVYPQLRKTTGATPRRSRPTLAPDNHPSHTNPLPSGPPHTMGIHSVVNACAHLQNASAARLGLTSIPSHKYNLLLALALHRAGFLSSVVRAGPHPPPPDALLTWDADSEENAVTTANVATRRLWLGLKYHDSRPVLRSVQAVSTPKRKTTATYPELGRIARGFHTGRIKGLNLGECLFVSTDLGVLEVREALEKRVGGLVLCRVS